MTDNAKCFPLVRGKALRVTKLDNCGVPVLGPTSVVVTKGFITVTLSPQNDEGTTITTVNANGDTCIKDDPTPKFLNFNAEIALCGVDPDLFNFLTGQPVVLDDQTTPQSVGVRVNSQTDLSQFRFALELWSDIPSQLCGVSGKAYGYTLLPFLQVGAFGDVTYGNDAINFTVSGAKTLDGNSWGVGPFNVVKTQAGASSPLLTALDPYDHYLLERVTLAPPATGVCGAQALGVPATSIVAGIPATSLPANSYVAANLAALVSAATTASPTTAWTTGQYVLLRDGSKAHWSGTAWVTGPA